MNYKLSMRIFSVIYMIMGLSFFVINPSYILQLFGVSIVPEPDAGIASAIDFWRAAAFVRVFGGLLLMSGVIFGFLAYIEGDKNRRLVTSGISIGSILLLVIMLAQQIAIWETIFGWILLAIIIITFVYFSTMSFGRYVTSKH